MVEAFDFATDRSEAAQAARCEALKGKKVLWLTCYYTAEVYDIVKPIMAGVFEKGVKIYIVFGLTDNDKKLEEVMKADGLVDGCLYADMADGSTACDKIYEAAKASGVAFDAVFSPHEVVQTLIGELSERMGLAGASRAAFVNARDKWRTRDVCKQAGISTPGFAVCRNVIDLEKAIEEIGCPVVLKPTAGSASEGVYKCESLDEARQRFDIISTEFRENPSFSWNPGCQLAVLCEEYIDGDEYDVDMLMWDGKAVYAGVIDNWPTMEPTFMETGSNFPSLTSDALQVSLTEYAVDCVRALGFRQGCFHVEIKQAFPATKWTLDANNNKIGKIMLIEVNPRMGGGRTHKFHNDVYGVDLFDNFLMACCSIPICPPVAAAPLCAIAEYEVCSEYTGVQLNDRWLDHLKDVPGVDQCTVYNPPGTWVKGADTGIPQWIGLIVVKGRTPEDAVQLLQSLVPTIQPPIQPDGEKASANGC